MFLRVFKIEVMISNSYNSVINFDNYILISVYIKE